MTLASRDKTVPPKTTTSGSTDTQTSGGSGGIKASLQTMGGFAEQEQALKPPDGPPTGPTAPKKDDTPKAPTEFDTWAECYKAMSKEAKEGYDQFVALQGEGRAQAVANSGNKDKTSGKYLVDRANSQWSAKKMTPENFDKAMKQKEAADQKSVDGLIKKVEHICDETDGTNRPGSVGDGTSEWALYWEAENGEPFRSPAGHGYKLRDYCKVIKEGLAEINAKKGSIKDNDKLVAIGKLETRANGRYDKMKAALVVWNARAATWPAVWNSDGTTKLTAPGKDPLARGQLATPWPKDAVLAIP